MKLLVTAFCLAAVNGCASTAKRVHVVPNAQPVGTYEFSAKILGRDVSGRLYVRSDTMIVDGEAGGCGRPVPSDSRTVRVECRETDVVIIDQNGAVGGAHLVFDRFNPGQGAKWEGNIRVERRRQVCSRYENRSGREVCAGMVSETYEDFEPKSGPVQVRKVN